MLVGNVTYAACQWGILIILARLGSPEMVGQYALSLAITKPIFMLTNMQLRQVHVADVESRFSFVHYVNLRFLTGLLAVTGVVIVCSLGGYLATVGLVVIAMGTAKVVESISDIFYGQMQKQGNTLAIAQSQVARGIASLGVVAVAVATTGHLSLAVVGILAAWGDVLLIHDLPAVWPLKKLTPPGIPDGHGTPMKGGVSRFVILRNLAWHSLPLGVVMMLIAINTNVPLFFVEHFAGERELGFYAVAASFVIVGHILITSAGQAASPSLAFAFSTRDGKRFQRLFWNLMAYAFVVGLAGVCVTLVTGRGVLEFVYGPAYAERADLLILLMVAGAVCYLAAAQGFVLTAAQKFRVQVPVFIGVGVTVTLACIWLIPQCGPGGAAWATLAGCVFHLSATSILCFGLFARFETEPSQARTKRGRLAHR